MTTRMTMLSIVNVLMSTMLTIMLSIVNVPMSMMLMIMLIIVNVLMIILTMVMITLDTVTRKIFIQSTRTTTRTITLMVRVLLSPSSRLRRQDW